ncbi:streptogramin lyase [Allocatelliglobosispora scoriae]|uniref:Streptogramin lyase n=1 Tax=Allocatelliglobosispora scoriae TaxID=643052 RepID=A0A841C4J3_9ACTN|nr:superoxide dismutase [Allocatelliglobosispora scoriae]MBB5873741.1 streptogramin lyase [Allocatelliglobosispora scoriae]
MLRRTVFKAALAATGGALTSIAAAEAAQAGGGFPDIIGLPDGFQPEGIAIGAGTTFYVGSLVDGAIYRGDLRDGRGGLFIPGRPGSQAIGLELDDRGRLWVCTGVGAAVYQASTGRRLAEWDFGGSFVNDAKATGRAVWFTDSYRGVLVKVPIGRHGELPGPAGFETVTPTGPLAEVDAFNNGIESTECGALIIGQMVAARLVRFDPATGGSSVVDLRGGSAANADGLLRRGGVLYVVRNFDNAISKFRLDADGGVARPIGQLTSPAFDIPATIGAFGTSIYAVNGRFNIEAPAPTDTYDVVRVAA